MTDPALDNGPAGDTAAIMNAVGCSRGDAGGILARLAHGSNGARLLITSADWERLDAIETAARAFRDECECPAPDLLERRRLRSVLFAAVADSTCPPVTGP